MKIKVGEKYNIAYAGEYHKALVFAIAQRGKEVTVGFSVVEGHEASLLLEEFVKRINIAEEYQPPEPVPVSMLDEVEYEPRISWLDRLFGV